jgi:hypothetical protein
MVTFGFFNFSKIILKIYITYRVAHKYVNGGCGI